MTLGLYQHIKTRTRSAQLDKSMFFDNGNIRAPENQRPGSPTSHRLSSLSTRAEKETCFDGRPASPIPAATVRRFKSMLEVEDPPKLSPWKPMSFEELYTGPILSPPVSKPAERPQAMPRRRIQINAEEGDMSEVEGPQSQATHCCICYASSH